MSDSFADLWSSSAPAKPAQKLGSIIPSVTSNAAPRRPQNDVFSMLSSAASSAPNSRPITPSMAALSQPKAAPSKPGSKTVSGGDAFGDLLGSSLAGGTNGVNMTIAERAAQAEKQRLEQMQRRQQEVKKQASAWDGLDTLGISNAKPSSSSSSAMDDDWGFGSSLAAPASKPTPQRTPPPPVVAVDDDWGLSEFSTAPIPQSQPPPSRSTSQTSKSPSLWDLDEFSSPPSAARSPSPPIPAKRRPDSPGDFDFGDREDGDGLLDSNSQDEDDILGVLSKPVDAIPKGSTSSLSRTQATPSPRPNGSTPSGSRPISPPPHILGQIVEMGFSVQQARVALASTETGLDVQAALETLLSNGAAASNPSPPPSQPPRRQQPHAPQPRRRPAAERPRDVPSPAGSQQDPKLQDQADKLLAQASEIGLSVFNKASSFWSQSKEKVQKAYEERANASASTSSLGQTKQQTNGRPKWMQEAIDRGEEEQDDWRDAGGAFRDDDSPPVSARPRRKEVPPPAPPQQQQPRVGNLFEDEAPVAYVSRFRHGRPKAQEAAPSQSAPPPPVRAQAPSPVRVIPRKNLVSASSSSISQSESHKAQGGEKFKLGQYAAAESSYSSAIACLPEGHLLLVPLYNNRALSRLKIGDYNGAIEDATFIVGLIGAGYHPSREAKVGRVEEGSAVDLGDGLVKALKRRAEAWEGRERWVDAKKDWETLAGIEWAKAGVRGDAVRGAGRCRRMVEAASKPEEPPKPKPKPKPTPVRPAPRRAGPTPPSQALSNLRSSTNAAEAEDQAKHELKDSVDSRLMAWKGGKETNIRALIASLDTVLWPELGLQKVGLSELVMPNQVKIRYTKAIAKVHPDKLNANNSTLEQRMLANGVFGALNDAWNAFKQ
ncbi:hypothetical protein BDQ12DRAFT_658124 [Crucibulum laeve]|uniref:UBA domain-containing protein n=1 Tax=Crucibulum laeve TaxID=68775 RepID=A0A5C3LKH7_9AGAR|nr:hypothetical protein BDQ12DRAFT_658124 [Crucibulum laeve]